MTDHSDLIERVQKELQRGGLYSSAGVITRDIMALLDALSSQSLSLSEAREEIERLKGLVAGIREIPQEPWQDIAAAPKDGTTVLGGHEQAAFTVWWSEEDAGWVDDDTALSGRRITYPVTHWMPLPEPPKALENGPALLADATNEPASPSLSSLRKGAEVAVKPLEWIDDTNKHGVRWVTRTPWGRVEILDRPNFGFSHMSRGATRGEGLSGNSVDALKEAIQHVYETRIRSALVSGSREGRP